MPCLTSDPLRKVVGHFIPGEVGRAGLELLGRVTQNYNNGIIVEARGGDAGPTRADSYQI